MVPQAAITAWSARAPRPQPNQIEQDLILSRLMIEIANDELLGPELAMRLAGALADPAEIADGAWRS
jgi:hypothetical protein